MSGLNELKRSLQDDEELYQYHLIQMKKAENSCISHLQNIKFKKYILSNALYVALYENLPINLINDIFGYSTWQWCKDCCCVCWKKYCLRCHDWIAGLFEYNPIGSITILMEEVDNAILRSYSYCTIEFQDEEDKIFAREWNETKQSASTLQYYSKLPTSKLDQIQFRYDFYTQQSSQSTISFQPQFIYISRFGSISFDRILP